MKRLIPILLALFAILTIDVICCNRAVINTATDRMYDDITTVPYNRVGLLLGTSPKGRSGSPNVFYATREGLDVIAFNALDVQLHRWQIRMTVREWLARTKAVLDVYTHKQPHFLGEL